VVEKKKPRRVGGAKERARREHARPWDDVLATRAHVGAWDDRHGDLRTQPQHDLGYRLVIAGRPETADE